MPPRWLNSPGNSTAFIRWKFRSTSHFTSSSGGIVWPTFTRRRRLASCSRVGTGWRSACIVVSTSRGGLSASSRPMSRSRCPPTSSTTESGPGNVSHAGKMCEGSPEKPCMSSAHASMSRTCGMTTRSVDETFCARAAATRLAAECQAPSTVTARPPRRASSTAAKPSVASSQAGRSRRPVGKVRTAVGISLAYRRRCGRSSEPCRDPCAMATALRGHASEPSKFDPASLERTTSHAWPRKAVAMAHNRKSGRAR